MKEKVSVGDKLFASFSGRESHLTKIGEVEVIRVGRKYFWVCGIGMNYANGRFYLDGWGYADRDRGTAVLYKEDPRKKEEEK